MQRIENLSNEQLSNIISKVVDAQEISSLLIKTRENDERIQANKSKRLDSKYIVEAIVEGYNWRKEGNSLTKKEKELLANRLLRGVETNNEIYKLYEAINKIQIGKNKFTQNDVFAIMVNIAIKGKMGNIQYSDLLKKDVREIQTILLENQESMQTVVLPISIDLLADRGKEISKLKKDLIDLGIDKDFIESKDIKNVYVAKQIVDEYEFGRELSEEERRAIIEAVLGNSILKRNHILLTTLISNMERIGLDKQQRYGMIINLGINGRVIEKSKYAYVDLLQNNNDVCHTIAQYKDEISTDVTEGTILKAKIDSLNQEDIHKLKEELSTWGIVKEFIDSQDDKNLYIAKQIIDGYRFKRELTTEERRAIIEAVLGNSILKRNHILLTTLISNMERIGLDKQQRYGMIINLGINGIVTEKTGYDYSKLLANQNNACQTIAQYKDEIQTCVIEETIQHAIKKANKSKKVKGQDIAKSTMELTIAGSGGSQVCDDVQTDYQRLMAEKTKENEREGSEQDVPN